MRKIEVLDAVRIRFPGRGEEFDDGVEIGALAVLMAMEQPIVNRRVPIRQVEQIEALAKQFRYRIEVQNVGEEGIIALRHVSQRPSLKVVR